MTLCSPRLLFTSILFLVSGLLHVLGAPASTGTTWAVAPYSPPSYPLAVRSPYLSTWLPQGSGTALNAAWPQFWTGTTVGWAGYARVDGTVYTILGIPVVSGTTTTQATQKSAEFTSTQSVFVLSAGPVDVTLTFLSPVEPQDLVKQSLPFSYLSVSAASTDGGSHSVQIYTDVTAEWVATDPTIVASWNTTTGSILTHQVQVQNQTKYAETKDQILQGSVYYSTASSNNVTYQTGEDTVVRAQFIKNGKLANTQDTNFRAIQDQWPVFGFAHDLGTVNSTGTAVLFSVGHVRDPAIQYVVAGGGTQDRSVYFWSQYSSVADVISAFLGDWQNALSTANAFDKKVNGDASAISNNYASIVALSLRQVFGAIEITISKESSGGWNTSDVLVSMKEISSDGNVNTVDVIFPAWPAFLYANSALGKYLLLGLFEYQATGLYPNTWSVHDLGASYPKAIGHNDGKDEAMPLEECGNMLIMTLSHYQKTGDKSLITTYSGLLDQWTQYLIAEALIPANQISTDDFAGSLANQTNLAIKGIVGIKAMSQIASILGDNAKSSNYSSIAASYVTQWQSLATSSDGKHLTLSYGNDSSWGLSYNLYGDKLLSLDLFPDSVYTMQDAWYPTVAGAYGVPLDTRHTYTKSDWQIYAAAIATDTTTRDLFINSVQKYNAGGANNAPFGDWYETKDGTQEGFRARPVVGGHLAMLVLPQSSVKQTSKSSAPRAVTLGGALAAVPVVAAMFMI
ncbi:hypothetical protein PLICRDRAFT_48031 [Plicaturopsis crispa FD-325 SS-3]|nr:hypothetical protein PLICRDRAFT_48031 [Plicaturopsis crispa FD-325 SS-3]